MDLTNSPRIITMTMTRHDGALTVRLAATGDPQMIHATWFRGMSQIDGPETMRPVGVRAMEADGWRPDDGLGPTAMVNPFLAMVAAGLRVYPGDVAAEAERRLRWQLPSATHPTRSET